MLTLADMEQQGIALQPRPLHVRTIRKLHGNWVHGKFPGKSLQDVWDATVQRHVSFWQPIYDQALRNRRIRLKLSWCYKGGHTYEYSVAIVNSKSGSCKTIRPLPANTTLAKDLGNLLQKYALAYNAEFDRATLGKFVPDSGSIVLYSVPML